VRLVRIQRWRAIISSSIRPDHTSHHRQSQTYLKRPNPNSEKRRNNPRPNRRHGTIQRRTGAHEHADGSEIVDFNQHGVIQQAAGHEATE